MSSPTEAEIQDQWQAVVDLLEGARVYADDTLVDKIDAVVQALETAFSGQIDSGLSVLRARCSDFLASGQPLLYWILRTYARFLESPETEPQALIDMLYEHFAEPDPTVIGPDAVGTGFAFAATVITRNDGGDWTDVFSVGDYVVIANAEDAGNNGTHGPVTAVSASDLTIGSAAFTVNADDTTATFTRSPIMVKSRGMSLAAPAADADNVGDGDLLRLTVDAEGYTFESGWADTKEAKVDRDQFSGTDIHQEELLLRGNAASDDLLQYHELGSGAVARVAALTSRNANTLQNAGFEQVTTSTAPSAGSPQALTAAPTGWEHTAGTIGDVYATTDTVAKTLAGVTLPIALEFRGNATFRQLLSTNRVVLRPSVPYLCGAFMRVNSALTAGTATISLGSKSIAQDLTALTDDEWTFVKIALGTGSWFKNFNQASLAYQIALASLAGTGARFYFDEAILAPGTFFDGSWYWAIGGVTAWLKGDKLTWTDTETSPLTGKIQRHMARAFGRYLPHSANPTFLDPA